MKLILATIVGFMGGSAYAQTDLNSTPGQLEAKYGRPVKIEAAWCGKGNSYGFEPTRNSYVYATCYGKEIADVLYFRFDRPFTTVEKEALFKQNQDPSYAWEGDRLTPTLNFDWNGEHKYKHLGLEGGVHGVKYQVNSFYGIVGNDHTHDGVTSYQVRTTSQFAFEQTAIKRILEEQKAKGTVTVGAVRRVK
jgi:hypothetical protein